MAGAPPALLIEAQAITVRIGRGELLSAVDLSVRAREVVSLIGPNGAGKTTLIRVLLGLLKPTAGRVWRQPGLIVGYVDILSNLHKALALYASTGALGQTILADEEVPPELREVAPHLRRLLERV